MKFTKEQIEEMSTLELISVGDLFAREEQAKQIRKVLLQNLEVEEAKLDNCKIIKLGSSDGCLGDKE